jgi:hypothetical protein
MPDTPDSEFLWSWLEKQQNPLCGLGAGRYWPVIESAIIALGQKNLASVDTDSISPSEVKSEMMNLARKTATHWSQSGKGATLKLSTIEWVVLSFIDGLTTP